MNTKIIARSPSRIDLAGGTLDLWPLYLFTGGGCVVNMAIDIYSEVEIEPREDKKVEFICKDLSLHNKYSCLSDALEDKDPRLKLLQLPLKRFSPKQGFIISISTQCPVIGAGLGGSSSLLISILKALSQWQKQSLSMKQQVELAVNIETSLLGSPAGSQDYYPAISGGISVLHYGFAGVEQELLSLPWEFSDISFLAYSGKSHHSGSNNFEVLSRACKEASEGPSKGSDGSILALLKDLNVISLDMAETLRQSKKEKLSQLFHKEYDVRRRLNPAFESKEIKTLSQLVMEKGEAEAVKICGAGGGGCLFVWCASESKKKKTEQICRENGYSLVPFHLVY